MSFPERLKALRQGKKEKWIRRHQSSFRLQIFLMYRWIIWSDGVTIRNGFSSRNADLCRKGEHNFQMPVCCHDTANDNLRFWLHYL